MAVYYKFKSEKKSNSISVAGCFITVACIKEKIFESRYTKMGYDRDLEISNPQTNEVYHDEATLIPKYTSVLVRRIPAHPRMRFVAHSHTSKVESISEDHLPMKTNSMSDDISTATEDTELSKLDDEFGEDIYAPLPQQTPVQASNAVRGDPASSKDEEDSKIKALNETPALDWHSQADDGFGPGRGFGRGGMMAGHGFGRAGFEWNIPPQGYVCHRCNKPGHFIQHCPTNGDPHFDIKKVNPSTGIPKTMLMENPEGSYVSANSQVATVKPDESTFANETGRIPTARSLGDLPPELYCPLCKEVMEYAVLTGRCCFKSFCDKCIRDYIISKSSCMCGARDILADYLIPNKTLRDTIKRILESSPNGSNDNAGSSFKLQDTESSKSHQPQSASPTHSATSKGADAPPAPVKETPNHVKTADKERSVDPLQPPNKQISDILKTAEVPDISEATHESAGSRKSALQGFDPPIEEESQQKVVATEVKPKNKKARLTPNAVDMQRRTPQDFPVYAYNPYWTGIQPGMEGHMGSFGWTNSFDIGYGAGPMGMPIPRVVPNYPFMAQKPLFPMVPPQRETPKDCDDGRIDISSVNFSSMKPKSSAASGSREPSEDRYEREHVRVQRGGSSGGHTVVKSSRREVDLPPHPSSNKRKSERYHDNGRDCSQDRDHGHSHHHHRRSDSSPRPSSEARKSEHYHDNGQDRDHGHSHHHHRRSDSSSRPSSPQYSSPSSSAAEHKHKTGVFSQTSLSDQFEEPNKKCKLSSDHKPSSNREITPPAKGYCKPAALPSSMARKSHTKDHEDYLSSNNHCHFKRKRYQPCAPTRQEDFTRWSVIH